MSKEKELLAQVKGDKILNGCLKSIVSLVFMILALMIGVQIVIYFVNTH